MIILDIQLENIHLLPDPSEEKIIKTNLTIENGLISEISPTAKIPDPELKISGNGLIALPPPINSHTHLPMTLLRGISNNKELYAWLEEDIWPIEGKFNAYWCSLGTKLAALEMIKAGCGGAVDMYFHEYSIGNILHTAGLRGWLGAAILPSAFVDQGGYKFQLEEFMRTLNFAESSPLINAAIGPHSQTTVEEEIILKAADRAEEFNVPIMIHASETRKEVLHSEEVYGVPPVERLDQIGFFRPRTKQILAHCTWITQREVEILSKHKATVGWCPVSSQVLAYGGVTPIPELRQHGAIVSLGTDGTASNNTLDLWREMREAVNVISSSRWDPALYPAPNVLEDTCWSFRRHFIPESFILEGNKADIAVLDFNKPHLQPIHSYIANIVYSANGGDVHSLIVDGKVLMHERCVLSMDEVAILDEINQKMGELMS